MLLKSKAPNVVFRAEVDQRWCTCEERSLKVACFHFADVRPKIPPWYQHGKTILAVLEFLITYYHVQLLYYYSSPIETLLFQSRTIFLKLTN